MINIAQVKCWRVLSCVQIYSSKWPEALPRFSTKPQHDRLGGGRKGKKAKQRSTLCRIARTTKITGSIRLALCKIRQQTQNLHPSLAIVINRKSSEEEKKENLSYIQLKPLSYFLIDCTDRLK